MTQRSKIEAKKVQIYQVKLQVLDILKMLGLIVSKYIFRIFLCKAAVYHNV